MSKYKGEKISVEIFGTSHAPEIGVNCKGFPKMQVDLEKLSSFMNRRRPSSQKFSTLRKETDEFIFTKGVNGCIIEDEFSAIIKNIDKHSQDYADLYGKPRPSHADYCSFVKSGSLDFTGGGKFSARLTAPYCIAGGIAKQFVENKGIKVYAYLSQVGKVKGKSYKDGLTEEEIKNVKDFPAVTNGEKMLEEISNAKDNLDSVGAVAECVIYGLPVGLGDSYFDGLEGRLASIIYSIPAVKGVEFGSGFDLASMNGSIANDEFYFDGDKVKTKTNNSGGINGGISNGMPITMRIAFRPTPSIAKTQNTVDLVNKTNTQIVIKGRHDACVAVRALPVIESAVSLCLLDTILIEGE